VVFSGDTAPFPSYVDRIKGADLLIHEAMLESALFGLIERIGNASDKLMAHWLRSHTFAHDAARIATQANVGALALTHLIPPDDPTYGTEQWKDAVKDIWNGKLIIGHDGLQIPL